MKNGNYLLLNIVTSFIYRGTRYEMRGARAEGSVDDGLRPKGDVVGVALEEFTIGHAE